MTLKIPRKEINRLAFPAMIAGLSEPLIGLADTAILGNMPGNSTAALAAVGLGTQFFFFLFWTFVQIESALSAIVSRYLGEGRLRELQSLISQSVLLNIVIGLLLYFLSNLFIHEIFDLYNAEGLVHSYSVEYFSIRSLGYPVILVTYSIFGVFRGLQNTSWAMYVSFAGAFVNIILDLILVYGVEGLVEPMGVAGAAWGSFIAQCVMLLISLILLLKNTPFLLRQWLPIHEKFASLLGMSGNFIIRTISLNLVLFLAVSHATKYGDAEIAAHTIAVQLWVLSAFLLDGYANAGMALSGKLLGQNNLLGLADLSKRLIKIGFWISLAIMIIYTALYSFLGSWFSNNQEVVEVFNTIFWIAIICQPLSSLAFTMDGLLKGTSESIFLRNMMIVGLFVFTACLWLSDLFYPTLQGVWLCLIAWLLIRSFWPWLFFKRKYASETIVE